VHTQRTIFCKNGSIEVVFFIRKSILFFLVFELSVFLILYCFGPKGIKTWYDVCAQRTIVEQELDTLRQENQTLQEQIELSKVDFSQEKIAREILLMKKDDEKVYFVKS
jgi:cell division protein FtsB